MTAIVYSREKRSYCRDERFPPNLRRRWEFDNATVSDLFSAENPRWNLASISPPRDRVPFIRKRFDAFLEAPSSQPFYDARRRRPRLAAPSERRGFYEGD